MSDVFEHSADRTRRDLEPGRSIETIGLRLSLSVQDVGRRQQMLLRIDNLTDQHFAYRVVTRPSRGEAGCGRKETLYYNANAIRPGETLTRSECTYGRGWVLEIQAVETVTLPELGFHYVSAVPPRQFGIDTRLADGHTAPGRQPLCNLVLPGTIVRARDDGEISWRDMIDFYARHSCERYQFPRDYKAFGRAAAQPLPAQGSVP